MNKIKFVGFDLQGTLSDSSFATRFWREELPRLYAERNAVSIDEAKDFLRKLFLDIGRYDRRYYDARYWYREFSLGERLEETLERIKRDIRIFEDVRPVLEKLQKTYRLVLVSSTTKDFIERESENIRGFFHVIISTIDDLGIAGKPSLAFSRACKLLKTSPERMAYVGDDKEFDYLNARGAGLRAFLIDRDGKGGIDSLRNLGELMDKLDGMRT